MKRILSTIDTMIRWLTYISALVLFLMMANVEIDVLLRYTNGKPLPLTLELVSYYYMIGIAFIPLALVERKDGHIAVDLVVQFFPIVVQRLIEGIMSLVGGGFFSLMARVTFKAAWSKWLTGEYIMGTFSLPTWPASFALPLGFGLFALVLLLKSVVLLAGHEVATFKEDADELELKEGA